MRHISIPTKEEWLYPPASGHLFSMGLKFVLLGSLISLLVWQIHSYSRLVIPAQMPAKPLDCVGELLLKLGAPQKMVGELSQAVRSASRATHIPEELLIALLYTESAFNPNAVSKKGYKGLMQTPHKIPYTDASVLYGARILEDKLRLADGNLEVAVAMYKGGRNKPRAVREAAYTISLYRKLAGRGFCPGKVVN